MFNESCPRFGCFSYAFHRERYPPALVVNLDNAHAYMLVKAYNLHRV